MTIAIETIYNYIKLSSTIATAGQPTAEQLTAIRDGGYEVVVNLALPTSPNALPDERDRVEQLGMDYVNIPVEWESPISEQIQHFFDVMNGYSDCRVFVHCAANKRVSAFMYLYRVLCQHLDPAIAAVDLHRIWHPNPTWQAFITATINQYSSLDKNQ